MNSKKLWHSFALIFLYLTFVAVGSWGISKLFISLRSPWGVPFGIGVGVWITSLVFLILHENHPRLARWALTATAISCAFFITAFFIGKGISVSLLPVFFLSTFCAFCYLLLMLLMSVPKVSGLLWYEIVAFIVWLTGSVLLVVFALKPLLVCFSLTLPEHGFLISFFLILLGFLAFGSLLEAENFSELFKMLSVPMLIATGIIALIVLLALSGCDSCDGGDCCDCSTGGDGKRKSTKHYTEKNSSTSEFLSQRKYL